MGWGSIGSFVKGVGGALGIGGERRALNAYGGQMEQARSDIQKGYAAARPELEEGMGRAKQTYQEAYDPAEAAARTGFTAAQNQLQTGGTQAQETAKAGFAQAQGRFDTNEMVQSRQQLYQRMMGQGGLSEDVVAQQRANEIEQAGGTLKAAQRGIGKMTGDAGASGLAAENMARATAAVGAEKAKALRDINIGNEQLKRQEQTGAISSLQAEAGARAGLSAQEAQYVSGLQQQLAQGTAQLTQEQTGALAEMAMKRGETLAGMEQKLAEGKIQLTVEEAKALAELAAGQGAGQLAVQGQKGLISSIFG